MENPLKSPHSPRVSVAILAGGRSSRFKSNKALAPWMGGCVIDAVISAALDISEDTFLVTNDAAAYARIELDKIPDLRPGLGPLAGLEAALDHSKYDRVFLLACDMPLVSRRLLRYMAGLFSWAPCIVPQPKGGLEPLHAIYHRSLQPLVKRALDRKRLSVTSFVENLPARRIRIEEISMLRIDVHCLRSANTPSDLKRLQAICQDRTIAHTVDLD